jgi:hypothetical protein
MAEFVVLTESAGPSEPSQGAFDDPALGKNLKRVRGLGIAVSASDPIHR